MDYTRCYYKLLDSQMYQMFPEIILERLINKSLKHDNISSSSKELFIIFNILLLAGKEDSKIFKMIINKKSFNFIDKLKKVIYHQKEEEGRELQLITIKLFFEICSVQPLSQTELGMIDEYLLNHLLDLVEITRDEEDETFNYSIIRLILSFNEQFMLSKKCNNNIVEEEETLNPNTVIRVLSKRIGTSETFGENIIFMLNRSVKPHIQMLILKLLYEIFTTPETFEYFYTNDLRVLIDVFIRELYDLPDESEAVRHTYLRVLYPLISNTQLNRDYYKQNQIYKLLLDLNGTSTKNFKPVSPTTQRLVDRFNTIKLYYNSDLNCQATIGILSKWLEARNIIVATGNLHSILQAHSDEFLLSKAVDLIKFDISDDDDQEENDPIIVGIGKQEFGMEMNQNRLKKEFRRNQQLQKQKNNHLNHCHQKQKFLNGITSKINKKDIRAISMARSYLDKHLVDSTFELERHLKNADALSPSRNFKNFLNEYDEIFYVHKQRGINCVQLKNPSRNFVNKNIKTMIDVRMEQTENHIRDYIQQNDTSDNHVVSTELIIYLRGIKGTITYDLKDFLNNCSDSFECYENDGSFFVKNKAKASQPINPSVYHSQYRSSSPFVSKLIRDLIVKEYIVTYLELEEYIKKYSQLQKTNLKEFLYSNDKEFNITIISGETYITLKPTDRNILFHIRRFLLEHGKVQLSLVGSYLRHMYLSPIGKLKELLSIYSDFKFDYKSEIVFVKSQEAEIIRAIRELFASSDNVDNKKELKLTVIADHLHKKSLIPNSRLLNLLESYTEFDFYQSPVDIVVVHKPDNFLPNLKLFIRKMIVCNNGQVELSTLFSIINWKGDYPIDKLHYFIVQSNEFALSNVFNRVNRIMTVVNFKSANNALILVPNSTIKANGIDQTLSSSCFSSTKPNNISLTTTMTKPVSSSITDLNTSTKQPNSEPDLSMPPLSSIITTTSSTPKSLTNNSLDSTIKVIDNDIHTNSIIGTIYTNGTNGTNGTTNNSTTNNEILCEHLKNQEKQLFSSFKTVELWKNYFVKYKGKTENEIKVRDEEIKRSHQEIENLKKMIARSKQFKNL
nr:6867_t:CDS:10 [Entrophospora candida]